MRPSVLFLALFAVLVCPHHGWAEWRSAHEANAALGRGINFGNALEAPEEGDWGMIIEEEYFDLAKKAGFDSIRLPVKWSAHAATEAPYTIDPKIFERVDWAIDNALKRDLCLVLNVHHYDEFYEDADEHLQRFLAIWKQISGRYSDRDHRLFFEILNEPRGKMDEEWLWRKICLETIETIRATNKDRMIVVGGPHYNCWQSVKLINLPGDDRNLIATFHYYDPIQFTHQGAGWVSLMDMEKFIGTKWEGTMPEKVEIVMAFDAVAEWANKHDRPVYLGEFGAIDKADIQSRAAWTEAVAREAEKRGFSWAYWEFGAGFGIYDREAEEWRPELVEALIPEWDPAAESE